MGKYTIRSPLHTCQEWLAAMGGKVPELLHLPVIGRKGEQSINFIASFFQGKGSEIRGVRLFEPGFEISCGKPMPSLNDMMTWASAIWYLLPLNGEMERGVNYKQSWKNGRWVDWTPKEGEEVQPPVSLDQQASSLEVDLTKAKASVDALRVQSGGQFPASIVLTVVGTKPGPTETVAGLLAGEGVHVRGVRYDYTAFTIWHKGGDQDPDAINQWTSFVWDNLPLNAEVSPGYKYKLVWENDAWRDWTPSDDAPIKHLGYSLEDWVDDFAGYADATTRLAQEGSTQWIRDHFARKYRDSKDHLYKIRRFVRAMAWHSENKALFDRGEVSVVGEKSVIIGNPLIEALYRLFSRMPDEKLIEGPDAAEVEKAIQDSMEMEQKRKKSEQ